MGLTIGPEPKAERPAVVADFVEAEVSEGLVDGLVDVGSERGVLEGKRSALLGDPVSVRRLEVANHATVVVHRGAPGFGGRLTLHGGRACRELRRRRIGQLSDAFEGAGVDRQPARLLRAHRKGVLPGSEGIEAAAVADDARTGLDSLRWVFIGATAPGS